MVFWSLSSRISLPNNLLDEIINATELTIQERRLPEICCKGPCSNNISLRLAYEFQDWWAINKSNPASMFECLKYYGNVVHWAKYMILVRPSLKESSNQMMQTFYVSGVTDPWKSMVWQRTHTESIFGGGESAAFSGWWRCIHLFLVGARSVLSSSRRIADRCQHAASQI